MDRYSHIDVLFEVARKHERAFTIAQIVGDSVARVLLWARLRRALDRALLAIETTSVETPSHREALRLSYAEVSQGIRESLRRAVPKQVADVDRLVRWVLPAVIDAASNYSPDLFEVDSRGVSLQDVQFTALHIMRCRLMTDMTRARFVDARLEETDLTLANLSSTYWYRTEVTRCWLAQSSLVDADFSHATFIECDLRDADVTVKTRSLNSAMSSVRFIRCNLRGVIWHGRDMSRVEMLDCQTGDSAKSQSISEVEAEPPARRVAGRSGVAPARPSPTMPML